jgi:hypothetical protein
MTDKTRTDQSLGLSLEPAVPDLICSSKGCRKVGVWALRWNNPKLHTPERRKTWLACEEHREHLSQFLAMRGFLKETMAAADLPGH